LPQEAIDLLNQQREKARKRYEKNKAKIRVKDQARRNDPEKYERMKQRSKLWNRKRYQEVKNEDHECECGAHIKRVSLHTHLLTKRHLNATVLPMSRKKDQNSVSKDPT
jgi:chromatin segregation and condensation protein Rec8/ScpA/Scc1 (kleisin family)